MKRAITSETKKRPVIGRAWKRMVIGSVDGVATAARMNAQIWYSQIGLVMTMPDTSETLAWSRNGDATPVMTASDCTPCSSARRWTVDVYGSVRNAEISA